MFSKLVKVRCDDCLDAEVVIEGGSTDRCWQQAQREGWKSFPPPKGEPWKPRTHVCRRCVEYGRPYAGAGVPSWRGLGLVAGQNAASGQWSRWSSTPKEDR